MARIGVFTPAQEMRPGTVASTELGDDVMRTNDDMLRRYGLCVGAAAFGCCCGLLALDPIPIIQRIKALDASAAERVTAMTSLYAPVVLSGFVAAAMGLLTKSRGGAPLPLLAAAAAVPVALVVSPVRMVIGDGAMFACSLAAILGGMVLAGWLGRVVQRGAAASRD
jgi:hypothetical protein